MLNVVMPSVVAPLDGMLKMTTKSFKTPKVLRLPPQLLISLRTVLKRKRGRRRKEKINWKRK